MKKAIRVRMADAEGKLYNWTVRYMSHATVCEIGRKPYHVNGWSFTDHEGCERFQEGNWMDLVARFRATADNYGFVCNIS